MLRRLADLALRRPRTLLGGSAAAAAIAIAASLGAPGDLGVGSTGLERDGRELIVVLDDDAGAGAGVLAVAGEVVVAQLAADPAVGEARLADGAGEGRASVIVARLEQASAAEREETVERLSRALDPGPLRLLVGGEAAAVVEAKRALGDELWRLELLAVPFVLLLAAVAVGARAAIAPVICVASATAGTLALLRLAGLVADVSLLGVVPALAVGTVLGIEMPGLVARLHRDQAAIAPGPAAMRPTALRAAAPLARAAAAGALPGLALLATPLPQAGSLALGCALAAALAATSALIATPAAIAIFGGLDRPRRGAGEDPGDEPGRLAATIGRGAGFLASSRLRCAAGVLVVLAAGLVIGSAALDGSSRPFAPGDLPAGSEAGLAAGLAGTEALAEGGSLLADLPLAAAIAAALLAIAFAVMARVPRTAVAAPLALLPAAAGLGACVYVLDQGHLAGLIGASGRGVLDTAAVAAAVSALAAIGAARAAIGLDAARTERRLWIGPAGSAQLAAARTLPGAAAGALAGVAVTAVLVGSDLAVARELGLAVAVGLLADLLLVRVPLLAALARTG